MASGFQWDEGNLEKNLEKHGVAFWEAEEIFFNRPFVVRLDSESGVAFEWNRWSPSSGIRSQTAPVR